MLKLSLLTIILLGTLTVFSQTGTNSNKPDSGIFLRKPIGVKVVTELVQKDSITVENYLLKQNLLLLNNNNIALTKLVSVRNNELDVYRQKEDNYNIIVGSKDVELNNDKGTINQLNTDLKITKKKLAKRTVLSTVIIAGLVFLIFKK